MELRTMTPEELAHAYKTDFVDTFPPSELKPLEVMEKMRQRGAYDPLGYFDGTGTVQGYIFLWKHPDNRYVLIDYLCVPAGRRNGGTGSRMLEAVRKFYPPDTVFLGESESPLGDPETDPLKLRRLGFYARSGAKTMGYDCALFGVHYKTLCWAEPLPDEEEALRKHQEIYLEQFGQERYDQYIQIPLRPGERPRPLTDWVENID